jgi:peptidyl-prolyl cis-trans isomerase C
MGLDKDPTVQKQIQIADEEVLGGARMRALRANIKMPDFDKLAREEYIAHKEKYVNPGQLDVKHILISTEKHSDAEAKALADDVRKQAVAHPDQFDALIDKYSEDPSKDNNHGLMQAAGDNKKYVNSFAAAANALKVPGEISEPVKTKFGYHILKLVARTSDEPLKFEAVKAQIVEQLRAAYVDKTVTGHTDEIRNQHLDADPDVVASLRTRYGTVKMPAQVEAAMKKDVTAPAH